MHSFLLFFSFSLSPSLSLRFHSLTFYYYCCCCCRQLSICSPSYSLPVAGGQCRFGRGVFFFFLLPVFILSLPPSLFVSLSPSHTHTCTDFCYSMMLLISLSLPFLPSSFNHWCSCGSSLLPLLLIAARPSRSPRLITTARVCVCVCVCVYVSLSLSSSSRLCSFL